MNNASSPPQVKKRLMDSVKASLKARMPAEEYTECVHFLDAFWSQIAIGDWLEKEPGDIAGCCLSLWLELRKAQTEPVIRVFNPDLDQYGWLCSGTCIIVRVRDMPFLVDSLRLEMNRRNLAVRLIKSTLLNIHRDAQGHLQAVRGLDPDEKIAEQEKHRREALVYMEIGKLADEDLADLKAVIRQLLLEVGLVVGDHGPMLAKIEALMASLKHASPEDLAEESCAFLQWIKNNHFTFLGYREFELVGENNARVLQEDTDARLGMFRHDSYAERDPRASISAEMANFYAGADLVAFSKSGTRSRVHRDVYPDYIVVKRFSASGALIGEARILGLFTYAVYSLSPSSIPLVRRKIAAIVERSQLLPSSHDGKNLLRVLETFPRDELFQSAFDTLYQNVMGVAWINERRVIRLFTRIDPFGKFVNCLVYVPRDLYNTRIRQTIEKIIAEAINACGYESTTYFSESVLARAQMVFRLDQNARLDFDHQVLEDQIVEVTRGWEERFEAALVDKLGDGAGLQYMRLYSSAFSAGYQESFDARTAVRDVLNMETLKDAKDIATHLFHPVGEADEYFRFKVMRSRASLELSDVVPILENLGMRVLGEHPYKIRRADGVTVWLHDFELTSATSQNWDTSAVGRLFEEAFSAVWHQRAVSDAFNRLVLRARLPWREVVLLRTYAAYMKQTAFNFGQGYIAETLCNQVDIARNMVALFKARFDPRLNERGSSNEDRVERLKEKILHKLEAIENLNEDKILRRYFEFIEATLRTNFYQKTADGEDKPYISLKLSPRAIADIPEPKPMYEIYVYSPSMEGVHLRGGKVARGGIRWSDRLQDYRTEVLGLVKAQQVKNAVIVPNGAKGGFVCKRLPAAGGREALQKEGIACYQTLIRGLLDLTDNFIDGQLVAPEQTVCRDDADPYMVVAADKGTASFSDIANEISQAYRHWLGDAFASGGSQGYDHKKMGITARGAWVCVQRHFLQRGLDVQSQDFTVVGIGDMAGDVFGNGMLRSKHIKLVAAFNHLHIFLDPNPDPARSFEERKRLFELPRSNWTDYDESLISEGGGVFLRTVKSIPLSPQVRTVLGVEADRMSPPELMAAILKAPVDLLWNGGIGTYVKAGSESHSDVGDKANDPLRVNGADLHCRVIGEGGNLGMTQLGRVEYALNGGACNTDFIDNSAGVDCSDHEVNIKILLNKIVADGDLTHKQRNAWLVEMTESVAQLVLKNNYQQTFALTLAEREAGMRQNEYQRFIHHLEQDGRLHRQLEFLPSDEELQERASRSQPLTRPELAVLLCYAKVQLKEALLQESIHEDAYVCRYVEKAFPESIAEAFPEELYRHRLLKEIVATQVANDFINCLGITAAHRLRSSTHATYKHIAVAFVSAKDIFRLDELRLYLKRMEGEKASDLQLELMNNMVRRIRRASRWFLRNRPLGLDPDVEVSFFRERLEQVNGNLGAVLLEGARADWQSRVQRLQDAGIEEPWLSHLAMPDNLYSGFSVVEVARQTGVDVLDVACVFFALNQRLQLDAFATQLSDVAVGSYWQAMARESFLDDLDKQMRSLTHNLVQHARGHAQERVDLWCQENAREVEAWLDMVSELSSGIVEDFAVFAVAIKQLVDLAELSLAEQQRA